MNKDTINNFIEFYREHQDLKPWEAFLAWMQGKYDSSFSRLLVEKDGVLYDTKNWTGEDNPMILFGNIVDK